MPLWIICYHFIWSFVVFFLVSYAYSTISNEAISMNIHHYWYKMFMVFLEVFHGLLIQTIENESKIRFIGSLKSIKTVFFFFSFMIGFPWWMWIFNSSWTSWKEIQTFHIHLHLTKRKKRVKNANLWISKNSIHHQNKVFNHAHRKGHLKFIVNRDKNRGGFQYFFQWFDFYKTNSSYLDQVVVLQDQCYCRKKINHRNHLTVNSLSFKK